MTRRIFAGVFAVMVGVFPAATRAEEGNANPQSADAMWEQIEQVKDPELDRTKTNDRDYLRRFFEERRERAVKRGDLAKQFLEQYPDHPKKAEALYVRAHAFLESPNRSQLDEFGKIVQEFVKAAPQDDRAASLLFSLARMDRRDDQRAKVLRQIIKDYPDTDAGRRAKGTLRQIEDVGKPFELSFTDEISGKDVSMKDLKGKVVVIDFWATWCGPCVAEMPEMKRLYAEYKDKGVEFIGVSLDAPEEQGGLTKLKEFVAKNEITWPQCYQGKGWDSDFSKGWGITGIPTVFIVDANGNLHSTRARGQLEKMIPELLKKAGKEVTLR